MLVDVASRREEKLTSLAAACQEGQADIVMKLLQCVIPRAVNILCGRHDDTSLHLVVWYEVETEFTLACWCGNNEVVKSLLYIADLNLQNKTGRTPLHSACEYDCEDIVQTLLSCLPNTVITDDNMRTPVLTARLYDYNEVVSCFFQSMSVDTVNSVANVADTTNETNVDSVVSDVTISGVQSAEPRNRYGRRNKQHTTVAASNKFRSHNIV